MEPTPTGRSRVPPPRVIANVRLRMAGLMRLVASAVTALSVFAAGGTVTDDQQIQGPDSGRIARQRALVETTVQERYGTSLPGGAEDLALLQRLVDDQVFRPEQTYELQSLGIVLGQVLAGHPDFSWVTVQDEYGTDPALRYKATSILVFPLTMISKRIEEGREVDVEDLYASTLTHVRGLEGESH